MTSLPLSVKYAAFSLFGYRASLTQVIIPTGDYKGVFISTARFTHHGTTNGPSLANIVIPLPEYFDLKFG